MTLLTLPPSSSSPGQPSGITDYLAQALLQHVFLSSPYPPPTITYGGLFTTLPTISLPGVEIPAGEGYAPAGRPPIVWELYTVDGDGAHIINLDPVNFGTAASAWGVVLGVGIFDDPISGNLLWWGPLGTAQQVPSGSSVEIAAGQLQITLV